MMVKNISYLLILTLSPLFLTAQMVDTTEEVEYILVEDSSVYTQLIKLKPVTIVYMEFENNADRLEFYRTKRYINNVYPYAMQALAMMQEMDHELEELEKKRKQKKKIRTEFKDLKGEYKDFLKDFYIEEGRLLIKIIERETGMTFYDIIKKYKGGFTAMYWEQIAKVNGYSLKDGYDPEEEEYMEIILTAMEEGTQIAEAK